jgi:hypothetical protein
MKQFDEDVLTFQRDKANIRYSLISQLLSDGIYVQSDKAE